METAFGCVCGSSVHLTPPEGAGRGPWLQARRSPWRMCCVFHRHNKLQVGQLQRRLLLTVLEAGGLESGC